MVVKSSPSQLALQKQFRDYLGQAFAKLEASVSLEDCEAIATTIQQSMVGPWRFFHTLGHCMAVGGVAVGNTAASDTAVDDMAVDDMAVDDMAVDETAAATTSLHINAKVDAIEMLAGAFHDVVYIQVDAGIPFCLASCLSPVVEQLGDAILLRKQRPNDLPGHSASISTASVSDANVRWLLLLFDLVPGEALSPQKGQNEFLSALIAVKLLENHVKLEVLVAIAVCIEATIPFRSSTDPHSWSAGMQRRLQQICQVHNLQISAAEQVSMIHRAVRIANRDVMSFAESSAAHFLADTWNLLPENHRFSPGGLHRIQDYRRVIEKTESFFLKLNPRCIFRQFQDEPSLVICQQWQHQAEENLAVGQLYLSCKLVAIALLEAVASPFGPQTPLSLFMGTLPETASSSPLRLEQFFPPARWSGPALSNLEEQVWLLLSEGRAASSHQGDVLGSPLAAFLLQFHGFEPLAQQRQAAYDWLAGNLPYEQFLQQFDAQFLTLLFESIHRLWEQRQIVLEGYFRPQAEIPVQAEPGGLAINLATRRQ